MAPESHYYDTRPFVLRYRSLFIDTVNDESGYDLYITTRDDERAITYVLCFHVHINTLKKIIINALIKYVS